MESDVGEGRGIFKGEKGKRRKGERVWFASVISSPFYPFPLFALIFMVPDPPPKNPCSIYPQGQMLAKCFREGVRLPS